MSLTDPDQPASTAGEADPLDTLNLVNAGYVADLYERYRQDPGSIDPSWREAFDSGRSGFEPVRAAPPETNGEGSAAGAPTTIEATPTPESVAPASPGT
jgi:2-oxoglutarate dehydrogenase E1 component